MTEQHGIERDFEAPVTDAPGRLIVDLDGYEGPLDVLLELARDQKVDLVSISILQLADQYLAFIAEAGSQRLELAADYLVMAAWLAYMKSRLLIPETRSEDEPSGPEMAAALRFQLRRLEGMRDAGTRLMARPLLGESVFARGDPEVPEVVSHSVYDVSLYNLLQAYVSQSAREKATTLAIEPLNLLSIEEAMRRLESILGRMPEWRLLNSFLPTEYRDAVGARSALASTLAASLELARTGRLAMRQDQPFGPIYVKAKAGGN